MSQPSRMKIRPQGRTYAWVVAATLLILVVGLAVPLIFAKSDSSSAATGPSVGTGVISVPGNGAKGAPSTAPTAVSTAVPSTVNTSGPLTASDQGVTPTTIKIGISLLNLAPVVPLGLGLPNYQTSLQELAFNTFINKINDNGGIYGRKIVPVYAQYNPLSSSGPGSSKAICLQFVKDDKVFAVLGVSDDVGPCASVQYHVPYISTGGLATEQEYFTQSHNYMISSGATAERTGENWASFLVSSGTIAGHKVGMINLKDGGVQELSGDAAANVLQQLGHPLTDREQVPNDGSASAATIAVQAHNMQSKGVDMVMLNTSFATAVQFMTAAQANHYYPRYLTSDTGSLASDGLLSKAPKVLNGAIGLTGGFYLAQARSGEPEPADMKACRTEFNAASKTQIAYGEASPLSIVCTDIDILQRGALNAGTDLTRANFVNAIQHVGGWELPGLFSGYSAPGRTDFNNATQPLRWLSSCQCYHTAGPVIPDKY